MSSAPSPPSTRPTLPLAAQGTGYQPCGTDLVLTGPILSGCARTWSGNAHLGAGKPVGPLG